MASKGKSAPKLKLIYFNARGRCEHIRYTFALGGVDYEDCRVDGEAWQKMKSGTPFGSLPVLEIDGKSKYGEGVAIGRYAATLAGAYSSDAKECLKIDSIVDLCVGIREQFVSTVFIKDEAEKTEKQKAVKEKIPDFFMKLEAQIPKDDTFFLGKKITLADIMFFTVVQMLGGTYKEALEDGFSNYKKLAALNKAVENNPKISAWIKKRPESNF